MGSRDDSATVKSSKKTPSTQETPTTSTYHDWSSMQAYYGGGAAPTFFASTIASPNPHPYLWGNQHFIPPYGPPLPYTTLYPQGGLYSHPSMTSNIAPLTTEGEGKGPSDNERASIKKAKGSSGNNVAGKSGENGKVGSCSGNEAASQSDESGSEDSVNTSDENANQEAIKKRSFDQMIADGANAQNNNPNHYGGGPLEASTSVRAYPATNLPGSMPGKPAANLNIGMDLWNASQAGPLPLKTRPNGSGVSASVAPAAIVGREGALPDHWIQDERELKRQRRKQSNRESARRSRLRKQAECEDLQNKVENLNRENQSLKEELTRISEDCEKLTSQNASLLVELERLYGADAVSAFKGSRAKSIAVQPVHDDGSGQEDRSRENDTVGGRGNLLSSDGNPELDHN